MSGTEIQHGATSAMRCAVLRWRMVLPVRYSGYRVWYQRSTKIAYGATSACWLAGAIALAELLS
eukprot:2362385-Rhodomonas_salina.1